MSNVHRKKMIFRIDHNEKKGVEEKINKKSSIFWGRLNIVKANKGREKNISKIYEKCRKKFL